MTVDQMMEPPPDAPAETWPGLPDLEAWGLDLPRRALPERMFAVTVGHGPRRALLVAYPAGHQPLGAAALPLLCRRLQERDAGFAWDVVPFTCPTVMELNSGALKTPSDMISTTAFVCRTARSQRFDADPARSPLAPLWEQRYDLCIVLRNRYFGGASVFSAEPRATDLVRPILLAHGFPCAAHDIYWKTDRLPALETWLSQAHGTRSVTLMLSRFSHPALYLTSETQTTQEELRQLLVENGRREFDRWLDWYEQLRPFLSESSRLRLGLDGWSDEQAEALRDLSARSVPLGVAGHAQVASAVGHGQIEQLLATAELLRLVREEIRQGHTVPALMAALRPLTAALQSAAQWGEQAVEVAPSKVAAVLTDAILELAGSLSM